MIKFIVLLLLFTSCSVVNETPALDMILTPPTPLPNDPNLDNGIITSPNPGGLYPPLIDLSEKSASDLPKGVSIRGKLSELINLLASSEESEKLILTIEDAEESYENSTIYLFSQNSDPTARLVVYTINSSILSQLAPLEKHINYQLFENKDSKVTDYVNIIQTSDSRITISIGGLSLTYILGEVDGDSTLYTFTSIHKGVPNMTIKAADSSDTSFFTITFPSFTTIKTLEIYTQ